VRGLQDSTELYALCLASRVDVSVDEAS